MATTALVDRLAQHKTLGSVSPEELEWLAAHGSLRKLDAGDVLTPKGAPVEGLYVVLSGAIVIYVDRGRGPQKIMEWRAGDVTGLLPYSRLVSPPGDTVAKEPTEILAIQRSELRALTRECHEVTSILVHRMLDRARAFNASDLQNEKMLSLGRLSAGLAHELNNPVAALERGATLLEGRLAECERASRTLGGARLSDEELAAVDAIREACVATQALGVRSPLEEAEREDAIASWLEKHGLDPAIAEELTETPVKMEALDELAGTVRADALDAVLRWAASGCAIRSIAAEIQESSLRVAGLVAAIKGFTHMDQAMVAEAVDLKCGLSNTIAVLSAKAKQKSAAIDVEVEPALPAVLGFAGELNQVWANLIDNAIDAIPDHGRIEVRARREGKHVAVRIVDNGPGIPAEIRSRIFEPFFTTKGVGEGTGLGLDIVLRLVRHNDGAINVESRPGQTEFCVQLNLAGVDDQVAVL